MLVPLATSFVALLVSAPAVLAQGAASSSAVTGDVTVRVTTTLPATAAPTSGNTTPTTDENSRIKFITELDYSSQQGLAAHKVIAPNSTVYHVCGTANAIEFDKPIPSPPSDKNPKGTTLAFLVGTPSGNETKLGNTMYAIDSAYAGQKIAPVDWSSSGRCVAGQNYYLTVVDQGCVKNETVYVQGCIWAVSSMFEYKPADTPLSIPLPKKPSGAVALQAPAALTLGALLAFVAVVL